MARTFNGTTDILEQAVAPITDYPCTFSCWFKKTALLTAITMVTVQQAVGTARILNYVNTAGETLALCTTTGNVSAQASKGTFTAGTWFHSVIKCANNSSRYAYLNGVAGAQDTANIPVSGLDVFKVGDNIAADGTSFDGPLAEVGVWNVALTDDEILALSKGFSPRLIRPSALKAHVRLIRELNNLQSGLMTATGTTVSDHPRIIG